MKRVGLLIAYKNPNYGTMLQAFATQYIVESLGCETEIIDYTADRFNKHYPLDLGLFRFLIDAYQEKKKKAARTKFNDATFQNNIAKRKTSYVEFIHRRLHNIKEVSGFSNLCKLGSEYDAVLISIGASTDKKLGIEGEHSEGVLSAVQFLRDVGKNQNPDLTGQEVAVIGGGNVSMDAVRTAKRLGAKKVSIVYRRRVADMTALPAEIEGAVAEGIEVQTLMAPSRIETDENGHVKGIYVTPQMISKIKDGRASVRPTGAPDVFIPCQTLIVAIGQDIEYQHFEEAGVPVQRGKILTEKYGGFDNIPGVFAGGDCASGPASVIKAIAAAKVVAANIDEYLGYHHIISCDVEIPEARLDDRPPCGRVNMTEREACERVCDFNGVENCMSEAEAKQEASRCLRCDHFGYGIFKGGRETLW